MKPSLVRDTVWKAVKNFGADGVAQILGRPVETVRFWMIIPDAFAGSDDMPPVGDIAALARLNAAEEDAR